jgi:hypothetical protein
VEEEYPTIEVVSDQGIEVVADSGYEVSVSEYEFASAAAVNDNSDY